MVVLYYPTFAERARQFLAGGFRQTYGCIIIPFDQLGLDGLWLTDVPPPPGPPGHQDEALLEVTLDLSAKELAKRQIRRRQDCGYREWLIPPEVLNARGTARWVDRRDGPEGAIWLL